ncbi:MAG: thioredoxin-disulfide reductase [Holosporales bacterium]|jgi:thioredoxin reductase (NADPH)|nr:thioredoxin-disulfide reductase [Holosporales bacterium]
MTKNTIIIGAGPAGLTCSIYLARSGVSSPLVLAGDSPGGQLMNTDSIENFPGFSEIAGPDLMMKMIEQAKALDVEIVFETVKSIGKINDGILKITCNSGREFLSRTIVIATGASHKHLYVPGEKEFTNKGVSWCATCDGPMYKGKNVSVIGGGNTALMESQFLANFAEKVYLIHRRDSFRADQVMQARVLSNYKIEVIWNTVVTSINGDKKVSSITLNNKENLSVDGVFIAIGTKPASDFVRNIVACDEEGYIITEDTMTSCPGIFAAGDVVKGSLKQAVYAAGQGALSSNMVEKFLGVR